MGNPKVWPKILSEVLPGFIANLSFCLRPRANVFGWLASCSEGFACLPFARKLFNLSAKRSVFFRSLVGLYVLGDRCFASRSADP